MDRVAGSRPRVHRIEVPCGASGRAVNVYLLPGRVPTLVDTGPALPGTAARVARAADAAGVPLAGVAQIILTHTHQAHAGALAALHAGCGAPILLHPRGVHAVTDPRAEHAARAGLLDRVARAAGAPPAIVDALATWEAAVESPGGVDGRALRPVDHGDVVPAGDDDWMVLHLPGHAPDQLVLQHVASGTVLAGDLVLRDRATRPALEPRGAEGRPHTLADLIASLLALGRLDASIILPGHGPPIRAHRVLIARRLADIRARLQTVRSIVAGRPRSLWDVARHLGGPVDDAAEAADRLAIAVAYSDWLAQRGWAARHVRDGIVFIERRAAPARRR